MGVSVLLGTEEKKPGGKIVGKEAGVAGVGSGEVAAWTHMQFEFRVVVPTASSTSFNENCAVLAVPVSSLHWHESGSSQSVSRVHF